MPQDSGDACFSLRYELHGAMRVLRGKGGPFEGRGEGTEKDVSLSGSHFKRLERTPSDEDKSYPRYETLDPMNF